MASGSPSVARLVDDGAARVAEAQEAGHLVVGLAGGVVEGLAQQLVAAVAGHLDQHGVAAGDQQHDHREAGDCLTGAVQERCVEVGLEVVDGHERHVPGECQGLGGRDADDEGAEQARPGRGRDGGGDLVGSLQPGFGECLLDGGGKQLQVGPAGDLGHHAAEGPVQVDLAGDHRGAHLVAAGDDGRRRLVTRRLDAQHRS